MTQCYQIKFMTEGNMFWNLFLLFKIKNEKCVFGQQKKHRGFQKLKAHKGKQQVFIGNYFQLVLFKYDSRSKNLHIFSGKIALHTRIQSTGLQTKQAIFNNIAKILNPPKLFLTDLNITHYNNQIQLITVQIIYKFAPMNPDLTSEIRTAQRFIFESTIYLLQLFQKKIDSFASKMIGGSKQSRRSIRENNLYHTSVIKQSHVQKDPIKDLSRDLTKPVWSCETKVDPKIIYLKQSAMEPIEIIRALSKILHAFFSRLKNEHEDESNLRLNLLSIEIDPCQDNIDKQIEQSLKQKDQNKKKLSANLPKYLVDFFLLLQSAVVKQFSRLEHAQTQQHTSIQQQQIIETQTLLKACSLICNLYLDKKDQSYNFQIETFNKIVVTNLIDVINCKTGSLVLCLQPKLLYLPLLVHPLLISIYCLLRSQLQDLQKNEQKKRGGIDGDGNMEVQKGSENDFVYGEITKNQNVSRVVFLNFDGFETEFNVQLAKYLNKSLMYVSFPKQSNCKLEGAEYEQIKKYEDFKSQRLLRKYFYGGLTPTEKKILLEQFKSTEKQLKRNLYMFPLHSRALHQAFGVPLLYNYETAFISFIMNQILYNQILDFNPSLIVISYSQKISIHNDFFVELMKRFTVLANYKVIFYANLSKNYMFEEFYSQQLEELQFLKKQKHYFDRYESHMKVIPEQLNFSSKSLNCDILEKIAIMTKISSGTYNLTSSPQYDTYSSSFNEKFKNFKAMSYSGPLVRKLSEQFSNLSKLKMRLNDYVTISKVLQSYFNNRTDTFDKLFKVQTKFHKQLFKEVQKILETSNQKPVIIKNNRMNQIGLTNQETDRRMIVEGQILKIKSSIEKKYNLSERKQSWNGFKFQKILQICTQKVETRFFLHIPKYSTNKARRLSSKQAQNLICLEFFTEVDGERIPLQLSPSTSKIYYTPARKHPNALIFITNHLLRPSSSEYKSYYGVVTEQFDYRVSPKVELRPFNFVGGPTLTTFQTYTEFNYHETQSYVFMFWPKIFDCRKDIMHKYSGLTYMSQSTSLFFRAYRKQPEIFNLLPTSLCSNDIIPRHGCQCYEVEGTNTVYIFGGFYGDEKNYLLFQTDITRFKYDPTFESMEGPPIFIENIPKQFYFDYKQLQTNREIKRIYNLKNHMIRPKVQYQFLEIPSDKKQEKQIFLIGGVGQNFIRPYSMLGHMAHRVTFNSETGDLLQIRRIPMNNIIPVNTHQPVKTRGPMQANIVIHAQNRSMNLVAGQSGPNAYTIYHNNVTYNAEQERFQYETVYQFADMQTRQYRQQVSHLKRAIASNIYRLAIEAKSSRGQQYNTNFITVSIDNQLKYILELHFILPVDIKAENQSLPNVVKLTGASILSIDVNSTYIYGLIKHPIYTMDQCLLAYYDLNQLGLKMKENKPIEVEMKQLHKFDDDLSCNIVIAANSTTVAILHGHKFEEKARITELLLNRKRKNHTRVTFIAPSQPKINAFIDQDNLYQLAKIEIVGGVSCSLFLNQNNGSILCFSFKTTERTNRGDVVFVLIEKLQLTSERLGWQKVFAKRYLFVAASNQTRKNRKKQYLKILQIIENRKTTEDNRRSADPLKNTYEIIARQGNQCFSGKLEIENYMPGVIKQVTFTSMEKNVNDYFKELSKNYDKQHSIYLQKNLQRYFDVQGRQTGPGAQYTMTTQQQIQ